jgi:hypothetical protein
MPPFYCNQMSVNYSIMLLNPYIANYLKNIRSRYITSSYSVFTTQNNSSLNSGGISINMG